MIINNVDGTPLQLDEDGRARIQNLSQIAYFSEFHQSAYVWYASQDLGADKNVIWLRNDATDKHLHIDHISIYCSAAAIIEFAYGTGSTVGGTVVTGRNLFIGSGNIAEATCRHTNTNLDANSGLTLMSTYYVGASSEEQVNFNGALALGYLQEIAINVVTDIDLTTVNIVGYFDRNVI